MYCFQIIRFEYNFRRYDEEGEFYARMEGEMSEANAYMSKARAYTRPLLSST